MGDNDDLAWLSKPNYKAWPAIFAHNHYRPAKIGYNTVFDVIVAIVLIGDNVDGGNETELCGRILLGLYVSLGKLNLQTFNYQSVTH